jgi:hypothetical protein
MPSRVGHSCSCLPTMCASGVSEGGREGGRWGRRYLAVTRTINGVRISKGCMVRRHSACAEVYEGVLVCDVTTLETALERATYGDGLVSVFGRRVCTVNVHCGCLFRRNQDTCIGFHDASLNRSNASTSSVCECDTHVSMSHTHVCVCHACVCHAHTRSYGEIKIPPPLLTHSPSRHSFQ